MSNALDQISLPEQKLAEFCRRWRISELSAFGSVVRGDFREDSDIDLLVEFEPGARHTIFDVIDMEEELQGLFGRPVDLVEKRAIVNSDNYLRRRQILGTARAIFHA